MMPPIKNFSQISTLSCWYAASHWACLQPGQRGEQNSPSHSQHLLPAVRFCEEQKSMELSPRPESESGEVLEGGSRGKGFPGDRLTLQLG